MKRIKTVLLFIALFLFTSIVSYARIGETRKEAKKRYGKPISKMVKFAN